MSPDEELVLIFGALHLVALVFGGLLLTMFIRSETLPGYQPPDDADDDEGGGGSSPEEPTVPSMPGGGLPLPTTEPARVRLRDERRLADRYARPSRRPEHEPQPAPRVPAER